MTIYTPIDQFPDVQFYDTSDLVLGGATGNSSLPVEQLADRTFWLQKRMGGYMNVAVVTGGNIDNTKSNNLIAVVASGADVSLTIDDVTNFVPGCRLAFVANLSGSGGPHWLNITPNDAISDGNITRTNMYLYDGEMIELVAGVSGWYLIVNKTNYDKIGEVELKRFQPRNTVLANGTGSILRARFPRVIPVVSSSFVTDSAWTSNGLRYQQQYADGNGTTTFRWPDYRAMFFRSLDGGRGVDIGRMDNVAGGYEADALKNFTGALTGASAAVAGGNSGVPNVDVLDTTISSEFNGGAKTITKAITVTGAATEVRPRSAGFNPYIFY
jgi:hypothetical protein